MPINSALARLAAWLTLAAWLIARWLFSGAEFARFGVRVGGSAIELNYLYLDATWAVLTAALLVWHRWPPPQRVAAWCVASLSVAAFAIYATGSLWRYFSGASRAWDLGNYVQPMWRAARGLSMISAVYDGRPVWADHGAFAMFAFAPLTRLSDDAATGILLAQSLFVALAVIPAYALTVALGLPRFVALCVASVLVSSRALTQAACFDFHAECLFPLAFLGAAWAYEGQKPALALFACLVAISLRDMAALTMGMLWLYFALRDRKALAFALAGLSWTLAIFDIFALPRLSGWYSYVALNTSAAFEPWDAVRTTLMRFTSTFGIGWLHPSAWAAGAPWIAASALSPKPAVKGIDFQYGLLFVPVAALGAIYALNWMARRAPRSLIPACALWTLLAVSVNAPVPVSWVRLAEARSVFLKQRERLGTLIGPSDRVAADACSAPYTMERIDLNLLCRIDLELLQKTGIERWETAVESALSADVMVVREDCSANGSCAAAQVARAQKAFGFTFQGRSGPFVVLRKRTSP